MQIVAMCEPLLYKKEWMPVNIIFILCTYPCIHVVVVLTAALLLSDSRYSSHTLPFLHCLPFTHTHHPLLSYMHQLPFLPLLPPTLEGRAFVLFTYVHMWLCKCVAAVALSDIRCRETFATYSCNGLLELTMSADRVPCQYMCVLHNYV